MSTQPESAVYDATVYEVATADPVQGGRGGLMNTPLLSLSNRTAYLKAHLDNLENGSTIPVTVAPINSPAFTGSPTAPTPASGDRSGKIATTQFVQDAAHSIAAINCAGSANVVLTAAQAGAGILALTGALTGNIAVIVPSAAGSWLVWNNTTGAFSVTVKTAAGTGVAVTQGRNTIVACDATNVIDARTDFVSPVMTGDPQAPTPPQFDNDASLATTAFVRRSGLQAAGASSYTVSATIAATDVGKHVLVNFAAPGGTLSLPTLAPIPAGTAIVFFNWGSNDVGIAPQVGEQINDNGNTTNLLLKAGCSLVLVAENTVTWDVIAGTGQLPRSPLFGSSLAGNGWQKLPSGLIIQWGNITTSAGGATVVLPIAFPSGCFAVIAAPNAGNVSVTASTGNLGASGFPVYTYNNNGTVANATVDYVAFGH